MTIVKAVYKFVSDAVPIVCGMMFMLIGVGGFISDSIAVNIIAILCIIGGFWLIREQIRKEERRKATEWLGTITGTVASNVAIVLTLEEDEYTRQLKIWKDGNSEPPDSLASDESA